MLLKIRVSIEKTDDAGAMLEDGTKLEDGIPLEIGMLLEEAMVAVELEGASGLNG